MKYLSVLIVLALMAWTWSLATSPRDFSLEQHKEIEANFEQIVRQQVMEKNPAAKNIFFDQLYTEVVKPGSEMKVHFRYMLEVPSGGGDTAEQFSSGVTTLKWDEKQQAWTTVKTDINPPEVRFREGSRISTKDKSDTDSQDPEPSPTAPQASPEPAPQAAPGQPTPSNE